MSRSKRLVVLLALALAAVLVGLFVWRVSLVNAHAYQQSTEYYQENEWVEFDGAFAGYDGEETAGYALRVTSASIMTPRQYLQQFSAQPIDLSSTLKGVYVGILDQEEMDKPSLVVLGVEVRNDGNENGYMAALNWKVISEQRKELSLPCDWDMWGYVDESMMEQPSFTIEPGTAYETHIPFCAQKDPEFFQPFDDTRREELKPGKYRLVLTNVPVRKCIELQVDAAADAS